MEGGFYLSETAEDQAAAAIEVQVFIWITTSQVEYGACASLAREEIAMENVKENAPVNTEIQFMVLMKPH